MHEFLVYLIGELLFNTLLNLPFFLLREPRKEPSAVQWISDVLGTLAVGVALGLLSVWIWGHPLLAWPSLRWANLVLSPWLMSGLVVVWRKRRPSATAQGLLRAAVMTFCLTLGLVVTRYFSLG